MILLHLYRQLITSNGFFRVCQSGQSAGQRPVFRVMLKDFEIKIKAFFCGSLFLYFIKQIDSMLLCICSVIDHRSSQNVVRTSVTHSAIAPCSTFLFLPHFDVICDLLLNRRTATWNLFVKSQMLFSKWLHYSLSI